jgi:hypothetical protein
MDILCKIANSERDLIRIVVDVVSDLREGQGEEEDIESVCSTPSRDLLTIRLDGVTNQTLEAHHVARRWWLVF